MQTYSTHTHTHKRTPFASAFSVCACVHLRVPGSKGHFPRCPAAPGSSVTSSSPWATRGNKEAGLFLPDPIPNTMERHTHSHTLAVLCSAGKALAWVYAKSVCVRSSSLLYELRSAVDVVSFRGKVWISHMQQEVELNLKYRWLQKQVRRQRFEVLVQFIDHHYLV